MDALNFLLALAACASSVVLVFRLREVHRQLREAERSIRSLEARFGSLSPATEMESANQARAVEVSPAKAMEQAPEERFKSTEFPCHPAPERSEADVPHRSITEAVPPVAAPVLAKGLSPEQPPVLGRAPHQEGQSEAPKAGTAWEGTDWEKFMGARLFAWLGGLALFLGIAYFVKYSFDRDLIPPTGRVIIGLMAGLGLVTGGLRLRQQRYAVTSQTLCGTGIVILYSALFAGHAYYRLPWLPQVMTFASMVGVTVAAFLLAVRRSALVIALLGMLGGFLTPILVSSGSDQAVFLFTYVAVLDIGLIAVALHRRWDFLPFLGALGTVLMEIGWASRFFSDDRVWFAWALFSFFAVLFCVSHGFSHSLRRASQWHAGAVGLMSCFMFGFGFFLLSREAFEFRPGPLLAMVLVADLALLAVSWREERRSSLQLAGGSAMFGFLMLWQARFLHSQLLGWALGTTMVVALLHTAFPLILSKRNPALPIGRGTQVFPVFGVIVLLLPLLRLPEVSFALWPTILLLDVIALVLALWMGGILGAIFTLLLTGFATSIWIDKLPRLAEPGLSGVLLVTVITAGLFSSVGALLIRRRSIDGSPDWRETSAWMRSPWNIPGPDKAAMLLPVFAVLMPFLLLAQMVLRLSIPEPSLIFGTMLLISVLLLGLTLLLKVETLPLFGCIGLALVQWTWLMDELTGAQLPWIVVLWCVGYLVLFSAFPIVFHQRLTGLNVPWKTAALIGLPQFYLVYRIVQQFWPNSYMGLIPLAFAIPPGVTLAWLVRNTPREAAEYPSRIAWAGGATLFFVTLSLPVQFDRHTLTIALALEGAALLWLFRRVAHQGLPALGTALLAAVFIRLILNPFVLEYAVRAPRPILNTWLYLYGASAAATLLGARWAPPARGKAGDVSYKTLLTTLGIILAFALLNLEIADFFTPVGSSIRFHFAGDLARDMTYTIAWSVFALGLVGAGIARKRMSARWAGLGLLSVAVAKLFIYDLANLDHLYRVGALIGTAIVAIAASMLYQRYLGVAAAKRSVHNSGSAT